mmetsp:Transcript_23150/g.54999  ORF Transcript_23150/g.54999 Transcript_23150/m.54999 type:complete len:114 (+) Transcript_23150:211-552(+)
MHADKAVRIVASPSESIYMAFHHNALSDQVYKYRHSNCNCHYHLFNKRVKNSFFHNFHIHHHQLLDVGAYKYCHVVNDYPSHCHMPGTGHCRSRGVLLTSAWRYLPSTLPCGL